MIGWDPEALALPRILIFLILLLGLLLTGNSPSHTY